MLHGFKEATMPTTAEADSLQFLLWEGVLVLKETDFITVSTLGEFFFHSFYFGRVWWWS